MSTMLLVWVPVVLPWVFAISCRSKPMRLLLPWRCHWRAATVFSPVTNRLLFTQMPLRFQYHALCTLP